MARVHHADLYGLRKAKYAELLDSDVKATSWRSLEPKAPFHLFVPRDYELEAEYARGWKVTNVFPVNSVGIVTARDALTIAWTAEEMWERVREFVRPSGDAARERYDLGPDAQDWKVSLAQEDLRTSGPDRRRVSPILYRPFDVRFTYYAGQSRGFICRPRPEVMRHMLAGPNLGLVTARSNKSRAMNHFHVSRNIMETKCGESTTQSCILPLYMYSTGVSRNEEQQRQQALTAWSESEMGRVPNLAPGFVKDLSERIRVEFAHDGTGDLEATFGPEDVFHYIYAVLHSPTYRERYAQFLKADFPRIPLTSDLGLFRTLCRLGADLVALHLLESPKVSQSITSFPVRGDDSVAKGYPKYGPPGRSAAVPAALSDVAPPSRRQGRPEAGATTSPAGSGRVHVNREQYFDGVPAEVWQFQVGGYQVCEKWLKDRRGRKLSYDDLAHYQKVVVALKETIRLMAEVDEAVASHGGWPIG
jgi:hypothetical protein